MAMIESSRPPLSGVRVLDFGHHRAGPHCALVLARMGAEVIKIEELGGEQLRHHGIHWAQENNSKQSITIDLRHPDGLCVAKDLVKKSDVVVENFRPGVMAKLGLGYEDLVAINPRIIMASVSAYGAKGEHRLKPGFDGIMQGLAGLMLLNGEEGAPPMKTHPPIVDRMAGLHAAVGVLAALYERDRSGRGQALDIALLASAYSIGDADLASTMVTEASPVRRGNRAGGPPVNAAFRAADGWIYIATGGREGLWMKICEVIGRREWLTDPRFQTKAGRTQRADEIEAAIQEFIERHTKVAAVEAFSRQGVPVAPIRTPLEAVTDPYVAERRAFTWTGEGEKRVPVTGDLWHFSRSSVAVGGLPGVGEHTGKILRDTLQYSPELINTLHRNGVVGD